MISHRITLDLGYHLQAFWPPAFAMPVHIVLQPFGAPTQSVSIRPVCHGISRADQKPVGNVRIELPCMFDSIIEYLDRLSWLQANLVGR